MRRTPARGDQAEWRDNYYQSIAAVNANSAQRHHHHHHDRTNLVAPIDQQQTRGAAGSNRWTHFGARLRPLANGVEYHGAASSASSKTLASQQPPARAQADQPQAGADQDDDDDDQDSEALLYKMMQQQSFLVSPGWQEAAGGKAAAIDAQLAANKAHPGALGADAPNSKRMMKLLKSYSHIHQVDDSDDQIRGTYTRVAARRPQLQAGGWKPTSGGQPMQR